MRVGVLGGGLQGCCAALALAERAVKVTLFDKNDALLSRAAVANEGKIHLGYMYAGDPTLSTAKTMMAGALSFAPFSNVTSAGRRIHFRCRFLPPTSFTAIASIARRSLCLSEDRSCAD